MNVGSRIIMEDLEIMSKEEWRQVVGFEDYEVSDCGEVRNIKTKRLLTFFQDKGGYYRVSLRKNGQPTNKLVHRIVAEAFLTNPENKPCVDHIDTVRTNNTVSNLRWVTHKENANNELSKKHYSEFKTEWWKDEDRRKWMSESKIGSKNPNYGKHYTDEEKKCRRDKLSKPIFQYTLDGTFVKQYKSVKEAAEENGYDRGNLSRSCRSRRISYGSIWSYERI